MIRTLIAPDWQVRPTRHRLLITIAVSACFVAAVLALLGSIVDFVLDAAGPEEAGLERLTIFVRDGDAEPKTEPSEDKEDVPSLVKQVLPTSDDAARRQDAEIEDAPKPSTEVQPVRDWRAMATDAAKSSVVDYFSDRESRMALWRQSHARMFEPTGDFEIKEEEPIISDFRFKPEIHVVGLGFTIGSCFIGVPFLGVPVEQRSVAFTYFVCADDSG